MTNFNFLKADSYLLPFAKVKNKACTKVLIQEYFEWGVKYEFC